MVQRQDWGAARVAFLAIKDEVADRIRQGQSMVSIWRELKPNIDYKNFCKLKRRHLPNVAPGSPPAQALLQLERSSSLEPAQRSSPAEPRRAKPRYDLPPTDPATVRRETII